MGYVNPCRPAAPESGRRLESPGLLIGALGERSAGEDATMTEPASPEQLRSRLRRIEGQIRGISNMLETDRTCEEVVTQLMAVRSGVDNVGALMLDLHVANCMDRNDAQAQMDALRDSMRLWWRFAPGASGFGPSDEAVHEVDAEV